MKYAPIFAAVAVLIIVLVFLACSDTPSKPAEYIRGYTAGYRDGAYTGSTSVIGTMEKVGRITKAEADDCRNYLDENIKKKDTTP